MQLELFQIDAFTDKIFGGNTACVVPLSHWLPDNTLLKIAQENAVAETAYFIQDGDSIHLRWFTPEIEMDLCGHATLAVAHVLKTILHKPDNEFNFKTISGELKVYVNKNQYTLDFPSSIPVEDTLPDILVKSLNIQPVKVLKSRDYILVYNTEREIRDIRINRDYFDLINLDPGGIVVTAPGISSDYVYRFFTPQSSILEDPATGNTQCSLIPYWSKAMNKTIMSSHQLSKRGGKFHCEYKGERILITGQARTYFVGTIWIQ